MSHKLMIACAAFALGSFGCSNTVRHMTATHWLTPAGGQGPLPTEAAKGTMPSPGSPPPTGKRVLYLTYWEGSCSSGALGFGRGCAKGDSRVKRCEVEPDNTLVCLDENDINKALSTSN